MTITLIKTKFYLVMYEFNVHHMEGLLFKGKGQIAKVAIAHNIDSINAKLNSPAYAVEVPTKGQNLSRWSSS